MPIYRGYKGYRADFYVYALLFYLLDDELWFLMFADDDWSEEVLGWKEVIKSHVRALIARNFAESANLSLLIQRYLGNRCGENERFR